MMNLSLLGRWILRNGNMAVVHVNPTATDGNRIERYLGHPLPNPIEYNIRMCWNENGECVWMQGIVDDTKKYDLIERIDGKDRLEARMKVNGCKECEE